MSALATKSQILDQEGYVYSFDRQIYMNRRAKKAFSVEFVEDNSEEELQRRIRECKPGSGWQFYFTSEPSEAVKRELERALG